MRTTASGTRALAPTTPTIPTSYTPGPYAIGDTGYITSTDRDHHYVAQVCHDRNGQRHLANEALLAAAPVLHQALVEVLGDYRNDLALIRPRTLKLIVSALAKVEGGAA